MMPAINGSYGACKLSSQPHVLPQKISTDAMLFQLTSIKSFVGLHNSGIVTNLEFRYLPVFCYGNLLAEIMAEQQLKKIEAESPAASAPLPAPVEAPKDVANEKAVVPPPQEKADDSKALAVVEKTADSAPKKVSGGSIDRDVALADLEKEKRLSFIKAWEDSEKTKAENKAQKKLSAVGAWENSKKAALEAKLRKIEEQLEKKKAEYAEKMKNQVALVHKQAEEKRAMVEAKRGEEILKAEEVAAKYRATGQTPKKFLGCF